MKWTISFIIIIKNLCLKRVRTYLPTHGNFRARLVIQAVAASSFPKE